jgi:hypothetical protein
VDFNIGTRQAKCKCIFGAKSFLLGRIVRILMQIILPGIGTIILWAIKYYIAHDTRTEGLTLTKSLVGLAYWLPKMDAKNSKQANTARLRVLDIRRRSPSIDVVNLASMRSPSPTGPISTEKIEDGLEPESDPAQEKAFQACVNAAKELVSVSDNDIIVSRLKEIKRTAGQSITPSRIASFVGDYISDPTRDNSFLVQCIFFIAGDDCALAAIKLLDPNQLQEIFKESSEGDDPLGCDILEMFYATSQVSSKLLSYFIENDIALEALTEFVFSRDLPGALELWRQMTDAHKREIVLSCQDSQICGCIDRLSREDGRTVDIRCFKQILFDIISIRDSEEFVYAYLGNTNKDFDRETFYDMLTLECPDVARKMIEATHFVDTDDTNLPPVQSVAEFKEILRNPAGQGIHEACYFKGRDFSGLDAQECAEVVLQDKQATMFITSVIMSTVESPTPWTYHLASEIFSSSIPLGYVCEGITMGGGYLVWALQNNRPEIVRRFFPLTYRTEDSHYYDWNIVDAVQKLAPDAQKIADLLLVGVQSGCPMTIAIIVNSLDGLTRIGNGVGVGVAREVLGIIWDRTPDNMRDGIITEFIAKPGGLDTFVRVFGHMHDGLIIKNYLKDNPSYADSMLYSALEQSISCGIDDILALAVDNDHRVIDELCYQCAHKKFAHKQAGKKFVFEYLVERNCWDKFVASFRDHSAEQVFRKEILSHIPPDDQLKILSDREIMEKIGIDPTEFYWRICNRTESRELQRKYVAEIRQICDQEEFNKFAEFAKTNDSHWASELLAESHDSVC